MHDSKVADSDSEKHLTSKHSKKKRKCRHFRQSKSPEPLEHKYSKKEKKHKSKKKHKQHHSHRETKPSKEREEESSHQQEEEEEDERGSAESEVEEGGDKVIRGEEAMESSAGHAGMVVEPNTKDVPNDVLVNDDPPVRQQPDQVTPVGGASPKQLVTKE